MKLRNNTCPCCTNSLLRHVRQGEVYWFCTSCRQEVPLLGVMQSRLDPVALRSRSIQAAVS